jgi:hypothetical protein
VTKHERLAAEPDEGVRATELLIERGRDREAATRALRLTHRGRGGTTKRPKEASMTTTATPVDLEAVKTRQQGTWASGDYAVIGTTLQITGESLCEAVDVSAGQQVLDVAAGEVLHIPSHLPHKAEALETTLDVDIFCPPRQDWLDGSDAYLRRVTSG